MPQENRSPHDRAMDRHEAALKTLADVERRAADAIQAASREAGEALAELVRYERKPGIPLPVAEQERVEAAYFTAQAKLAQLRGQ